MPPGTTMIYRKVLPRTLLDLRLGIQSRASALTHSLIPQAVKAMAKLRYPPVRDGVGSVTLVSVSVSSDPFLALSTT